MDTPTTDRPDIDALAAALQEAESITEFVTIYDDATWPTWLGRLIKKYLGLPRPRVLWSGKTRRDIPLDKDTIRVGWDNAGRFHIVDEQPEGADR